MPHYKHARFDWTGLNDAGQLEPGTCIWPCSEHPIGSLYSHNGGGRLALVYWQQFVAVGLADLYDRRLVDGFSDFDDRRREAGIGPDIAPFPTDPGCFWNGYRVIL